MFSRLLAVTLAVCFVSSQAEAQGVDGKKLRSLVRLPTVSMLLGIGFNSERGLILDNETVDHSAEIALWKKPCAAMRGTPIVIYD